MLASLTLPWSAGPACASEGGRRKERQGEQQHQHQQHLQQGLLTPPPLQQSSTTAVPAHSYPSSSQDAKATSRLGRVPSLAKQPLAPARTRGHPTPWMLCHPGSCPASCNWEDWASTSPVPHLRLHLQGGPWARHMDAATHAGRTGGCLCSLRSDSAQAGSTTVHAHSACTSCCLDSRWAKGGAARAGTQAKCKIPWRALTLHTQTPPCAVPRGAHAAAAQGRAPAHQQPDARVPLLGVRRPLGGDREVRWLPASPSGLPSGWSCCGALQGAGAVATIRSHPALSGIPPSTRLLPAAPIPAAPAPTLLLTRLLVTCRRDPPAVGSGHDLRQWMCRAHNAVNRSLGKPAFNCAFVEARWGGGG